MNGRRPPADLDLRPWLDMASQQADVVAVGLQEVVPLNAGNVVMGTQHSAQCPACGSLTHHHLQTSHVIGVCEAMHTQVTTMHCKTW